MTRRLVSLGVGMAVVLFLAQWLFREACTWAGVPATEFVWVLWAVDAGLAGAASLWICGWRGLSGTSQLRATAISTVTAIALYILLGVAIINIPPIGALRLIGPEPFAAIMQVLLAGATVTTSWVVAGRSHMAGGPPATAST